MALEGVKSEKSEENNGNVPDGKANGIDNKSKQVRIELVFSLFPLEFPHCTHLKSRYIDAENCWLFRVFFLL